MEKSKTNIVVIDDDGELDDLELIFELRNRYENVVLKSTIQDGIDYIKSHLEDKIIVLLDYRFTSMSGHTGSFVLEEIRKVSKNIPVILWTANADNIKEFIELINNKVFAILPKSPIMPVISKIAEAEEELDTSLEGALEEWLIIQGEESEEPYLITANGKQYNLKEILTEVRLQTDFGKNISKDLLMLTIDLLIRNKETLNG